MSITVYSPDQVQRVASRVAGDYPKFMFDGFGIRITDQQAEARERLGAPGPRLVGEHKYNWLSGGQRAGKTVEAFGLHAEACLYKNGVDTTDERFWDNYLYGTLAIAPTTDLALRLWQIGDEVSKGSSDAQFDKRNRRARGGAFCHLLKAGNERMWPIWHWGNGSVTNFRSSEGRATRLEGGQWWFITWDEWATQPDREIKYILSDVLLGRARDHDAKIMPMAWPKPETERHLINVIRNIEKGVDHDSQVIYLSAEEAHFTNRTALSVEKRTKTSHEWARTVLGRPAGGAAVEFKPHITERLFDRSLAFPVLREDGYRYLTSADIGIGHDSTVVHTFRIPMVDGRPVVTMQPEVTLKARVVNAFEVKSGPDQTLDRIAFEIMREQQVYNSLVVVDATGMGGLMAFRALKAMNPPPMAFTSRSNDRLHGNMRLAAITNALDLLTWGRTDEKSEAFGEDGYEWGLIESPWIVDLADQLANFDRDAKGITDDWAWSFMIGCWYIKQLYLLTGTVHVARAFDVRSRGSKSRLVRPSWALEPVASAGVRLIRPQR